MTGGSQEVKIKLALLQILEVFSRECPLKNLVSKGPGR